MVDLTTPLNVTFGIFLTVFGSSITCLGSNIQKMAGQLVPEGKEMTHYLWWIGLFMFGSGNTVHLAALIFAPASILAPLNSLALVANAIAAYVLLGEKIGWHDGIVTSGIVLGVAICAASAFGNDDKDAHDRLESLWRTGSDPFGYPRLDIPYIVYFLTIILLVVFLFVFRQSRMQAFERQKTSIAAANGSQQEMSTLNNNSNAERLPDQQSNTCIEKKHSKTQLKEDDEDIPHQTIEDPATPPLRSHNNEFFLTQNEKKDNNNNNNIPHNKNNLSKELDIVTDQPFLTSSSSRINRSLRRTGSIGAQLPMTDRRTASVEVGIAMGALAGIVGSQTPLEMKMLFQVFFKMKEEDIFYFPEVCFHRDFYAFIWAGVMMMVSGIIQTLTLNDGLQKGNVVQVIPSYYCYWTIFGSVGAFLKFHELMLMNERQIMQFCAGLTITLVCTSMLGSEDTMRTLWSDFKYWCNTKLCCGDDDGEFKQNRLEGDVELTLLDDTSKLNGSSTHLNNPITLDDGRDMLTDSNIPSNGSRLQNTENRSIETAIEGDKLSLLNHNNVGGGISYNTQFENESDDDDDDNDNDDDDYYFYYDEDDEAEEEEAMINKNKESIGTRIIKWIFPTQQATTDLFRHEIRQRAIFRKKKVQRVFTIPILDQDANNKAAKGFTKPELQLRPHRRTKSFDHTVLKISKLNPPSPKNNIDNEIVYDEHTDNYDSPNEAPTTAGHRKMRRASDNGEEDMIVHNKQQDLLITRDGQISPRGTGSHLGLGSSSSGIKPMNRDALKAKLLEGANRWSGKGAKK